MHSSKRWATARRARHTAALLLTSVLAACGGGGGGGSTSVDTAPTALPTACQSGAAAYLALPATAAAGRNQEVTLLACPGFSVDAVKWRQTAGPALALTSARSQALSVAPADAGSYGFAVDYTDSRGVRHTEQGAVAATAPEALSMALRGEPTVWSGGGTSLRAWVDSLAAADYPNADVRWTQTAGPTVTLDTGNTWRQLIIAPAVTQDTLVQLRASATLADGRSVSQAFNLLVQPAPALADQPLFPASSPSSRVVPYVAGGPYAASLADCIYRPGLGNAGICTLGRLPPLAQDSGGGVPTVEQVMARVLVSNDWMGQRFEAFLREQDTLGDFRRLLNATTAVVIGGRVRPAFYWSATGAIYLDADYLWQTPTERDTVSERPDPRSDYGNDLAYTTLWRYVSNQQAVGARPPVLNRSSRDTASLVATLGRVLYHELTHANDFLPPRIQLLANPGLRVYQASPNNTASEQLRAQLPFASQQMVDLGRVQFFGTASTPAQRAYQPDDIVAFFTSDRVTDDYNYAWPSGQSVPREDAAMLAEEALMQLRHGIVRDFAIVPQFLSGASADQPVTWGQRGRVGLASIRPRVALVLSQTMPWLPANFTDGLAAPVALRPGATWGQNLNQAALAAGRVQSLSAAERVAEEDLNAQRRQYRVGNGESRR